MTIHRVQCADNRASYILIYRGYLTVLTIAPIISSSTKKGKELTVALRVESKLLKIGIQYD